MRGFTTESLSAGASESLRAKLHTLEAATTRWLARWSVTILRVGLGVIFLGFGLLKFFPGMSPAEGLVVQTLDVLTFGMVPARVGVVLVAALECAIGMGLITGRLLPLALMLLGFQMIGAMSPLLLFPGDLFGGLHHAPTLEGQYVLKDVVLVSAGLVIGVAPEGGGGADFEYALRDRKGEPEARRLTEPGTDRDATSRPGRDAVPVTTGHRP